VTDATVSDSSRILARPVQLKPVCAVVPLVRFERLVVKAYGLSKLVMPVPDTVPFKVVVPELVNAVWLDVPFRTFATAVKVAYVLVAVALVG
jgi:hypothetical protein